MFGCCETVAGYQSKDEESCKVIWDVGRQGDRAKSRTHSAEEKRVGGV